MSSSKGRCVCDFVSRTSALPAIASQVGPVLNKFISSALYSKTLSFNHNIIGNVCRSTHERPNKNRVCVDTLNKAKGKQTRTQWSTITGIASDFWGICISDEKFQKLYHQLIPMVFFWLTVLPLSHTPIDFTIAWAAPPLSIDNKLEHNHDCQRVSLTMTHSQFVSLHCNQLHHWRSYSRRGGCRLLVGIASVEENTRSVFARAAHSLRGLPRFNTRVKAIDLTLCSNGRALVFNLWAAVGCEGASFETSTLLLRWTDQDSMPHARCCVCTSCERYLISSGWHFQATFSIF